ncbi:hypothetical protein TNCV_3843931 [Trichonephila clavipes]|nr:hypothetical protein TNCV_3843931 [Trichonephila clavipes]
MGIHRVLCTGAGVCHPFWHGCTVGRPHQQPDQGSAGILPKSHVRWGLPVVKTWFPAWPFGRLSHCWGSQHDLGPIVMSGLTSRRSWFRMNTYRSLFVNIPLKSSREASTPFS